MAEVVDDRGVLLDDVVEGKVLLAVGQVEDVRQSLLTGVDPGEESDGEHGEAPADEDRGEDRPAAHRVAPGAAPPDPIAARLAGARSPGTLISLRSLIA